MIDFVIEHGIPAPPIPEYRGRSGRPPKYDWARLNVGDSVLLPDRSAAHTGLAYALKNRLVFTVKKQTGERRGWRVWRVA